MRIPVVFLGTGQAIPTARKNHTSILINYKNENIMVDCGEGTQRQFRKLKLNPCKLTKILITHWHGDHILGIPGLLQTLALNGYNKTLEIYGPKNTENFMKEILGMFIFEGKLKYKVKEVTCKFFENSDFYLEALPMAHGAPCLAYSFVEKDKIRIDKNKLKKLKFKPLQIKELMEKKFIILGKKKINLKDVSYKQKGKKITIILDTAVNQNAVKISGNSDLLISEATYSEKEKDLAKRYHHLTASQAADIARKSRSRKLILAHLSQRYENKENLLLKEARKIFKNSFLAEDLDKFEV